MDTHHEQTKTARETLKRTTETQRVPVFQTLLKLEHWDPRAGSEATELIHLDTQLNNDLALLESLLRDANIHDTNTRTIAIDQYKKVFEGFTRIQKVLADVNSTINGKDGTQRFPDKNQREDLKRRNARMSGLEATLQTAVQNPDTAFQSMIKTEQLPNLGSQILELEERASKLPKTFFENSEPVSSFMNTLEDIWDQLKQRSAFVQDPEYRDTNFAKLSQTILDPYKWLDQFLKRFDQRFSILGKDNAERMKTLQEEFSSLKKTLETYLKNNQSVTEATRRFLKSLRPNI